NEIAILEPPCGTCWRVAGQLVSTRLARQRSAIGAGDLVDRVGDAVFGVGDKRLGLLGAVLRRQVHVRLATAVGNGGLSQYIAEGVHLQRQRVGDARVAWVALIVIAERFARMGEEDAVAVVAAPLQYADREVLLGNGVGVRLLVGAVQGIDLLAQH